MFLCKTLSDKYSSNLGRKILHMGIGFPGIFVWFLYNSTLGAVIPPIFATIMLVLAPQTLKKKFSQGDELHTGLIIYCISVSILTALFWQNPLAHGGWIGATTLNTQHHPMENTVWIGAAAFITLAWGDGLGGTIGRKYGKHTYHIPWVKEKSLEGSLGVGLGAVFSITFSQVVFGKIFPPYVIAIILGAVVAMVVEALSPKHTDNLFLPLSLASFLYFFRYIYLL